MPSGYSFYLEDSIVSLSSKFQFSRLRMSSADPFVRLRMKWLDWRYSNLFVQQQKIYSINGSGSEARVPSPMSDFLN